MILTVKTTVEYLSSNPRALRSFLGDPDAWIAQIPEIRLSDCDMEELRRVALDSRTFTEMRCREHLDQSGEARFCKGLPIGRRRFLLRASSALLAAPFAALMPRAAAAAPGNVGVMAVADVSCTNGVLDDCKDSACSDAPCTNTTLCKDDEVCYDVDCTNNTECHDSSCFDVDDCTKGCSDSTCRDTSECSNLMDCTDTDCQDNGCQNVNTCVNTANCVDTNCNNSSC